MPAQKTTAAEEYARIYQMLSGLTANMSVVAFAGLDRTRKFEAAAKTDPLMSDLVGEFRDRLAAVHGAEAFTVARAGLKLDEARAETVGDIWRDRRCTRPVRDSDLYGNCWSAGYARRSCWHGAEIFSHSTQCPRSGRLSAPMIQCALITNPMTVAAIVQRMARHATAAH